MPNSTGSELNVLLRHVPKIVVSRFVNNPDRPRGPESCSFLAAVALFDISGFSSLGSRLSEDERRQSRETRSNSNTGSQTSPVHLSGKTRSSSARLLHSEAKVLKSRSSQPVLLTLPGTTGSLSSTSSRESARKEPSKDDSSSEEEECLSPRDMMRQRRQSSTLYSSFTTKTSVATQGIAVETLTTTLNKSLEPVIQVILKHGGDIIKFAGDALIVMWETEASHGNVTPAGELVYRAVCCALEALHALKGTDTEQDGEVSHEQLLGMHVGIGVSNMTGNHVGGVLNRWEFYLSGDANRQMSFAEENAKKGQLALSPEAYDALETRFGTLVELDVVCHASGNYLILETPGESPVSVLKHYNAITPLQASSDLIGFLRCYVPGAIVSHLQKGLALTPCRLNVTVAFVKLEGVIEIKDAQTQLQTIHQNLCTIQECAYKAQGMLRQFLIDDKGAVAIVGIGLPPFFHENNAFRGVKFATYVLESGVRASIGVTTGSVYCGSVGSSARAEFAVVGDSINLAARLMSIAPVGEIYCDDRTHKETKDAIHFRDTLEMNVKGKIEPIQVFPVQLYPHAFEASTVSSSEPTCAAPYRSSDILDAVPLFGSIPKCNISETSTHRALVVCGDSGTGKTMLLNHVVQRHSLLCFKGNGDSMDTAEDFHSWKNIAKAMATVTVKAAMSKPSFDIPGENQSSTDTTIFDIVRRSSLTIHRPNQHGRPSRTSTLTTHNESSDSEADPDSSFSRKENTVDTTTQRITVLEYLLLHQQVTKETLRSLRHWLPYDDASTTAESTAETGEWSLKSFRQVMVSMIATVSAVKPILLAFDDAQWMDNRSLSLVLKVLEELPNVYFLITVRGISKHTASARSMLLALVMSLPSVDTRQMNCFSPQETSLFLCQQYHITIMDTQVLNFVFEKTEGNPGSLLKLVNFMLDAKYIAVEPENNSIVILKDLDEMDTLVPQHIRARVMSIVDSLDALAQTALKLLSINPQPTEERMVNGVLTLLSNAYSDGSMTEASGIRLKISKPTTDISLLRQVRESLVPCEKTLLTIDSHNKLYFFVSEEMRLVVYDTMLPSQRKVLHALYAEWLKYAAKTGRNSPSLATTGSVSSAGNLPTSESTRTSTIHPMPYRQYALLAYHLSQSDKPKEALEAYYLAAEGAMEAKELGFAEDCMHTSIKILNTHPRINDLSELETILLRSRIEFIRGTIAVENNDLSVAITHLSCITRLFNRKGSILRYYSINIQREGLPLRSFTGSRRTSFPMSTNDPIPATVGCFNLVPSSPKPRCIPRFFSFNNIFPSSSRFDAKFNRKITTKPQNAKIATRLRPNRIQAEQTVEALDQINFYRRKASALIKQINYAKKKQDELHRHIQKFAQRSLQAKDKR
ncbi:ATPase family associated domain-containing protein 16 [Phytophthora infestans]|uniref:ATPase family associated domain-containing protein 16 n=1 Tax=Phytophthora infestans TaxID=4787 RepID=A0A833SSN4_PHYIN|nr:ATPase family associated domain-containing protein 16 [Phytophthora infestans]